MNFIPPNLCVTNDNSHPNANEINGLKRTLTNFIPPVVMGAQNEPLIKRQRIMDQPGTSAEIPQISRLSETVFYPELYREYCLANFGNTTGPIVASQPQVNPNMSQHLTTPWQLGVMAGQEMLNSMASGSIGLNIPETPVFCGNQQLDPSLPQLNKPVQIQNVETNVMQNIRQNLSPISTFNQLSINSPNSNHLRPGQNAMSTPTTSPIRNLNAEPPRHRVSQSNDTFTNNVHWSIVESASRLAFGCIIILEIGRRISGIREASELAKKYIPHVDLTQVPANILSFLHPDITRFTSPLFPCSEPIPSMINNEVKIPQNPARIPKNDPKVQFYCSLLRQTLICYEQKITEFIHTSELSSFMKSVPEASIWKKPQIPKMKPGRKPRDRSTYENLASTPKLPPIQEAYQDPAVLNHPDTPMPKLQPSTFTHKERVGPTNEQERSESTDSVTVIEHIKPGTSGFNSSNTTVNKPGTSSNQTSFKTMTPELFETLKQFMLTSSVGNEIPPVSKPRSFSPVQSTSKFDPSQGPNIIRSVGRSDNLPAPIPRRPFDAENDFLLRMYQLSTSGGFQSFPTQKP